MRSFFCLAATCVAIGTTAVATTVSDTFTSFYVFGDSLSDLGRVGVGPGLPPYDGNSFSNGPVWAETFADAFGPTQDTENFARGGATAGGADNLVPIENLRNETFAGQVGLFDDAGVAAGDNPLVAAWFGANDLFAIAEAGVSLDIAVLLARSAATAVATNIRALNALDPGVFNDFLVFNLPDIGSTPGFNTDPVIPPLGDIRVATFITNQFNEQLVTEIELLEADDINVFDIDVEAVFQEILDDPGALSFDYVTESCLSQITDPAAPFCGSTDPDNVNSFLFIDDVHPTTNAHTFLAKRALTAVENELSPVPLPASAPLMLVGLGLLGWAARRNKHAA